ncbi:MAG TPA: NAD(P)H-hydrate dehydratase, partial [Acidimicrobiia bacterium]|nr:NAD(P)H-hydrate dehydratase [Acidimicrobiia bacterium]
MPPPPSNVVVVSPARLRDRPLPDHGGVRSKYDRGVAVVVGGSSETPGAMLLAGLGALRVGAGKLQIATAASARGPLAVAVPEARVVAVPETPDGSLDPDEAAERLAPLVRAADAVLIGPGAVDVDGTGRLLRLLLAYIDHAVLVVDAAAIAVLADDPTLLAPLRRRAVVMPNPAEMASLLSRS